MSSTTTSPTLSNYRYYDEQHPIFLNYICTVNGFHPRKLDKKFSYCYIGKRSSVTLNVLAQLFPKAFFQGITADRDDKITGTKLAKEANLPNITFTEGTLATVDPKDLPDFDYIVIHDFYSSLISETPTQLHNLLEKKLKERGILFISYICSPGGHSIAEICDLAAYSTLSLETDLKGKAAAALDLLQHLKTNQAAYFEDNTIASLHIEKMLNNDLTSLSEEFFGGHYQPFYVHQVSSEMSNVGLTFAGNAIPHLNFIDLAAPAVFHNLLKNLNSRLDFEYYGDFIRNQSVRKDVFVKNMPSLSESEQIENLIDLPFGSICAEANFTRTIQLSGIEFNYGHHLFKKLISILCSASASPRQISKMDGFSTYSIEMIVDAVRFLAAGSQIIPFYNITKKAPKKTLVSDRYQLNTGLNTTMLKHFMFSGSSISLVAANAGIGLEVSTSDALFALCSAEAPRDQVTNWALQRLSEANQQIFTKNKPEVATTENELDQFRSTVLPKLLELGILQPI